MNNSPLKSYILFLNVSILYQNYKYLLTYFKYKKFNTFYIKRGTNYIDNNIQKKLKIVLKFE